MSMVHASSGHLQPPAKDLLSEIAIVCRLARALFHDEQGRPLPGAPQADWQAMEDDYRLIRRHIEAVVPGFVDYERRIDDPGGFRLPHGPHDVRTFETAAPLALYPAADEIADFGAPQPTLQVRVAPLSAIAGAGRVTEAVLQL